jgi:uncharacterized membrane protein YdfJ with MMPL/SSD domain
VAVTGSLTVLPGLLAKLGRWVDRPRVPLLWRLTASRTGRHGQPATARFWPAVLRPALRAPLATLVVSVGLLLALAARAMAIAFFYAIGTVAGGVRAEGKSLEHLATSLSAKHARIPSQRGGAGTPGPATGAAAG